MKKYLIFAFALVASVLAFNSCNGNKQNNPSEPEKEGQDSTETVTINPADYINTQWRTDSCFAGGEKTAPPHLYIDVISDKSVVINGDTFSYYFKDNQLYCDRFGETGIALAELKKGWAHVKSLEGAGDVYLAQLPELDMDAMKMMPTEDDIVGTWKYAYMTTFWISTFTSTVSTNPGVETWTFEKGGKATYNNWFTGETKTGTWDLNGGLRFVNSPVEGDPVSEYLAVQPLTNNWMGLIRSDGTSYENHWWLCRADSPVSVGNPLIGNWEDMTEVDTGNAIMKLWHKADFAKDGKFTFDEGKDFHYYEGEVEHHYQWIRSGNYEVNGDIVILHLTSNRWADKTTPMHDAEDFTPHDEQYNFTIEGNQLTILFSEEDQQSYTKK